MTRKDLYRLPGIPEGWGISAMSQERHEPFIRPQPRCRRSTQRPRRHTALPSSGWSRQWWLWRSVPREGRGDLMG